MGSGRQLDMALGIFFLSPALSQRITHSLLSLSHTHTHTHVPFIRLCLCRTHVFLTNISASLNARSAHTSNMHVALLHIHTSLMCFFPPTLKISLSSSLFSLLHTCHTNISPLSTYILLTPISVSYKSNSSLVFLSNIHIFSHGYTQTQMHSLMGFHRYVYLLILVQFSSVQFSHSVVSDSLRPHGLQHARPPCPSPTPGAYSNSCPLSQ